MRELNLKSFAQVEPRWRGNHASESAVAKISGKEVLHCEGKTIVLEGEECDGFEFPARTGLRSAWLGLLQEFGEGNAEEPVR